MLDFSLPHRPAARASAAGPRTSRRSPTTAISCFGYPGNPDGCNYRRPRRLRPNLGRGALRHHGRPRDLLPDRLLPCARRQAARLTRVLAVALMVPYWVNEILRAFAFRDHLRLRRPDQQHPDRARPRSTSRSTSSAPNVALYAGLSLRLRAPDGLPDLQRDRKPGPQPDRGGARLGAPWWRIHRRVVIPFAKPGITSGCTMVFMLAAGALAAPQILGGPSSCGSPRSSTGPSSRA